MGSVERSLSASGALGEEVNLLDLYPRATRPIDERGAAISEAHRAVARRFGREFFDGDRLTGYGGYNYHPRFWGPTVRRFRDHYNLPAAARILDVGCAKGFMLHDFRQLMPQAQVAGIDISEYAIANAIDSVKPFVKVGSATELPYADKSFDLVVSINTIHNLRAAECRRALREISRVSARFAFVTVDAWRDERERINMLNWNLTALTYMHVEDWKRFFFEAGYHGDFYWFIAQ